ncbi:sulfotransferase family cytosolic 1B member 1, partial [Trichonephila clavata]
MFSAEAFRSAVRYKPRPDDVFIVTYPKCGTTWTQHTVSLIFSHGEPTMSGTDFFSAAPFLEMTGAEAAEKMPRPGAIKVHLPFHLTPWSEKAKYLYVTRNPKDCSVSYYHHMKNLQDMDSKEPLISFLSSFYLGTLIMEIILITCWDGMNT